MINPHHQKINDFLAKIQAAQDILQMPEISSDRDETFKDITRPGLIKDIIIARRLIHFVNNSKKGCSAFSMKDQKIEYQYYHALMDKACQIDQIKDITRIENITSFYLCFYNPKNPIEVCKIYECKKSFFTSMVNEKIKQKQNTEEDKVHISIKEDELSSCECIYEYNPEDPFFKNIP